MNTRIYLNNKYLEFTNDKAQSSHNQSINIEEYESEKKLKKLIEDFLDETKKESLTINSIEIKKVIELFKKSFYYIEAAGGFIEKENKFLFIRRHNRWDLPKGKLEKKETIEHAAVRECEEECGIKNLSIIKPLASTFHIYQYKSSYALKQSYWFYMTSDYSEELVPQLEESITEVKWFSRTEIESEILKDTYFTIADVTRDGLNAS